MKLKAAILEGVGEGEKVAHIVFPREREDEVAAALKGAGFDVEVRSYGW